VKNHQVEPTPRVFGTQLNFTKSFGITKPNILGYHTVLFPWSYI